MNKKNKIRSKFEIKQRKKAFLEATNLFKKNKIKFFLYGGVLLGFYRDKNFIKWDWDVEIGMFENDFDKNYQKIINILKNNNFKILNQNKDEMKIIFTKYSKPSVTQFEINGLIFDFINKKYIRKKLNIPSYFLNKLSTIRIFNNMFEVPNSKEKFLVYFYGNWRKKINTLDKSIYLNTKLRSRNLWKIFLKFRKLKRVILNFF
jgi:phosphorylcholine metabolism protein LicD